MQRTLVAVLMCLLVGASATAQDYGVTVKTDDNADFSGLETYAWIPGHGAFDREIHRTVVAAIERKLADARITQTDG